MRSVKIKNIHVLIFILMLFAGYSCSNFLRPDYEKIHYRKAEKYSKRSDVVYIDHYSDKFYSMDTIKVRKDLFRGKYIPIIIPGSNTTNFAYLYKIAGNDTLGIDSAACWATDFIRLNMKKERGQYLLKNYGCHYDLHFAILVE